MKIFYSCSKGFFLRILMKKLMKNMYIMINPANVVIKFKGESKKTRANKRGKATTPTISLFLVI